MPEGKALRNLFQRESQVAWLTVYFEGLVIDRDNRLREVKGQKPRTTVGPVRQCKFLNAARCLLSGRNAPDLAEIVEVLDWLFTTWQGYLPFVENTDWPNKDGKITRFWTIRNHYHELVAAMKKPETAPIRSTTTQKKPKAYYDHGEDFAMEDRVTELVETFAKTKRHPPSDFDLFEWRKTFRIMLGHRNIPFADIKLVVDALADRRLELDYGRYNAPYHLIDRDGEWEHILASVQTAIKRRRMEMEMRPDPSPKPSSSYDPEVRRWSAIDDFDPGPAQEDTGGSVHMAANAGERHRRYLTRCARHSRHAEIESERSQPV